MDVINAAKKISEAGNKLDKLTRKIAGQCPESSTKEDLLAYLERIALYCHQIQITSKVKADVQNISGELIVSGVSGEAYSLFSNRINFHKLMGNFSSFFTFQLDSATSLIQAAKNLMNAVVLTVKYSYVASTKYTRQGVVAVSAFFAFSFKVRVNCVVLTKMCPSEVVITHTFTSHNANYTHLVSATLASLT